ncbi:DUF6268 family outer membrane beta-barrel protein [Stigmatella erecta]|uniref:DUF6268 domain-containing protein n=1 Tax=Stigmatella erecta TaxID=83460 RepID=A0A1I0APG7_9BACT|nr:DUF6268 family outer membrane beta-barrel protein [Stigmatella erecta]SES96163.1 hypothetical protein SAMN05443639_101764 [Stigmatella erecta]
MFRGALFACIVLFAGMASAQSAEDRAYIGVTFGGGTRVGPQGARLDDRQQLKLRLPLGALFLGRNVLVPSFGYEGWWGGLEQRGPVADVPKDTLDRNFHAFQLGLTGIRPLSPRWMLAAGVMANTRTDFRSQFDFALDTSWTGFATATYLMGTDGRMRLTFGLAALYPFDFTPVVPIVSFVYRGDSYILELGLPRLAMLLKVGGRMELGLTGEYGQQVFRTPFSAAGDRSPTDYYARQTMLRVGPTVNTRVSSSLWLSTSLGVDLMNDYALLDKDRKRMTMELFNSTKPAPYLSVSLGWRPQPRPSADLRPAEAPSSPAASRAGRPSLLSR